MVAIGALFGSVKTGVGAVVGEGVAKANRALNQSINISVGDIDPKQIIKYCIIIAFVSAIVVLSIGFIRGWMIWQDQLSCGIANTGCDWFNFVGVNNCKICDAQFMPSYTAFWEVEWWWRCLLYLSIAVPIGLILYKWFMKLADYILRVDFYIKKIENWIYGIELEGEAERQIETRI